MDSRLRFGIIGLGYFGKHYVRLLRDMPGVELAAVASRSFDDKKEILSNIPDSALKFSDANDLIDDPSINAVIIATPAATHADFIKSAIKAGKHILVEKPLAMNLREAEDIAAVVEGSKGVFMIGHQYLFNDYIRELKNSLNTDRFGEIKYFFSEHLYPGPIREGIGCFWESASHEIAILDYLFDEPEILEISADAVGFSKGVDDFVTVRIKYASGMLANLVISWIAPEKVRRIFLGGVKGAALFDDRAVSDKLRFNFYEYPHDSIIGGESYFFDKNKSRSEIPSVLSAEPLKNQLEHFIYCIESGKRPLTDFAHGLRVIKVMDGVQSKISL